MIRLNHNDHITNHAVAATIGMFDGVHRGHSFLIDVLKQHAEQRGLKSAVVTFNNHPHNVVNPNGERLKMIIPHEEKLNLLADAGVDYAIDMPFSPSLAALTAQEFMAMLATQYNVKLLVVGYNHCFGHDRVKDFEQIASMGKTVGVEVAKAPQYSGEGAPVSSSIIRNLILDGNVIDAATKLGRPFTLHGKVIHGFHNGTTMGFPTANVGFIDPDVIRPHYGAYAALVGACGKTWQGMVNVGARPTLHNGEQPSIEVNIFDFNDNIYDNDINISFVKFMRPEVAFDNIDALRDQLAADQLMAREILNNETLTQKQY
ncbi:MAG: bifunctional riboflavin kinase/FAD synthetase [Muribaculaceae bacterium]|nr:bifunctional riboflavin kinase/FAD synthetase [Muribaculaceae bacterium]